MISKAKRSDLVIKSHADVENILRAVLFESQFAGNSSNIAAAPDANSIMDVQNQLNQFGHELS